MPNTYGFPGNSVSNLHSHIDVSQDRSVQDKEKFKRRQKGSKTMFIGGDVEKTNSNSEVDF